MKLEQGISILADAGGRSSIGSRDGAADLLPGRDQAWQRAMEQAEFAGWFKGPEGMRQSPGSASASDHSPALRMTAGQSAPMSHYSLFEPTQPSRFLADSKGETSGAPSSGVRGSVSSTGHATRDEIGYATRDESAQRLGNLGSVVRGLVASLRGAITSAAGSTVEFDVTTAFPAGAMLASRSWPIAAVPLAVSSSSEHVCAAGELTEAEASLAPKAQKDAANADPNPKIRIHVDWTEEGVRVWLGIDHDVEAALPQVQRQLDRVLAESGSRLLSLVCNGRPMVGPGDRPWTKSIPLAASLLGPYQQGFQGGDWSAGQPMFHLDEQVER